MNLSTQFNPVTKESQLHRVRIKPKRGNAGKFSDKTRQIIGERDKWLCVKCGSIQIESVPHHILFRSQLGRGTVDNGVTTCVSCHREAHSCREGRLWFEKYRTDFLIGGLTN